MKAIRLSKLFKRKKKKTFDCNILSTALVEAVKQPLEQNRSTRM